MTFQDFWEIFSKMEAENITCSPEMTEYILQAIKDDAEGLTEVLINSAENK